LRVPFALIARIKSLSTGSDRFLITIDGVRVCEPQVVGGASRRVDCAVTAAWNPTIDHEIAIQGPSESWTLEYLELATHHGNTSGAFFLVILPGSSEHFRRPTAGWIAATWVLLTGMLLVSTPKPRSRRLRWLHPIAVGAVLAIWALSECSQWISGYRIVMSAGTFTRSLALLVAPQLWFLGRRVVRPIDPAANRWTAALRACLVALLVLGAFGSVVVARLQDSYGGNYSGFLQISKGRFNDNPLLNARADVRSNLVLQEGGGYDGQFMYFETFDPLLRAFHDRPSTYRQVVDAPPYRYGRIGFSLLARVFSAGDWQRYPVTMVWLILCSLFLIALLLALIAETQGLTPAFGALVILIPGFWQSLQFALPEPIAAAALVGGVLCLTHRQAWLAGGLFALSLLVRETGVVAVVCVVIGALMSGRRREGLIVGTVAIGILALWRLYVGWLLFPDWGLEGFFFQAPVLGWPLAGIVDLWRAILRGEYYPGIPELSLAGLTYPVVIIGGFGVVATLVLACPSAINVAALCYAIMAISLNFQTVWLHVGNGQRGTYELFLMLALSSLAVRSCPKGIRAGLIGFWSLTAAYVFWCAYDATYIRTVLSQTLFGQ
jgi:hypothetical protein